MNTLDSNTLDTIFNILKKAYDNIYYVDYGSDPLRIPSDWSIITTIVDPGWGDESQGRDDVSKSFDVFAPELENTGYQIKVKVYQDSYGEYNGNVVIRLGKEETKVVTVYE